MVGCSTEHNVRRRGSLSAFVRLVIALLLLHNLARSGLKITVASAFFVLQALNMACLKRKNSKKGC